MAGLEEREGLAAEGGEGGEAAAEARNEEVAEVVLDIEVCEEGGEEADDEASNGVDEEGSEGELATTVGYGEEIRAEESEEAAEAAADEDGEVGGGGHGCGCFFCKGREWGIKNTRDALASPVFYGLVF